MTDFPDLKIKALVNFPANVIGDAGIDVVKTNGTYHLNIAYDDFAPVVTGIVDPTNQTILTWNTVTEQYALAPISVLTGVSAEDLHLIGINPYLEMVGYSAGVNSGPWIDQKLARGTQATPAAVQIGDYLCGLSGYGYDGAGFTPGATIYAIVDDTVSVGNMPASWVIATSLAADLKINSAGDMVLTGLTPYLEMMSYSGPAGVGAWIDGKKHRGTRASPTAVHTGDALVGFGGYGYDGSTLLGTAGIYAEVDGAVSFGNVPTAWVFVTGFNSADERLRITSAGHSIFTPGSTTPPTLATNGNFVLTPTSNTNLRISYRGSDGVTRVGNIALAP